MNPKYDMQQYKKYPTFKKNALKKSILFSNTQILKTNDEQLIDLL